MVVSAGAVLGASDVLCWWTGALLCKLIVDSDFDVNKLGMR